MLLWLGIGLVGAAPPAEVDLERGEQWEQRSEALLRGPDGCWEVVGRATWDHDYGRWGGTRGDAVFAGRLEDGVWGEIAVFPLGEVVRRPRGQDRRIHLPELRFAPMIGQVRGLAVRLDRERTLSITRSDDPRVDPVNTVRDVVGQLNGQAETWWVTWEEEAAGVLLHRVSTAGRRDAEVVEEVFFPGGALQPSTYALRLEGSYVHRGLVPAAVSDLSVTLQARPIGAGVLPQSERVHFSLSLWVASVEVAQTVRYQQVIPCAEGNSSQEGRGGL